MNIRQVHPNDLPAIHDLHLAAFGDEGQSVADLAEARRLPARMLVLGADEENGLARLVFGSATARLLRASPCPVFIHG